MDDEFKRFLELTDTLLNSSRELGRLIRPFQEIVWNSAAYEKDKAWEIIGDLAYDLDFCEPDPIKIEEDYSFYGKERAVEALNPIFERFTAGRHQSLL